MENVGKEGFVDILEYINSCEYAQFKDIIKIINKRTNKVYSGNTITKRLYEIVELNLVSLINKKSERKRVIAYTKNDKTKKILDMCVLFNKALKEELNK